MGKRTRPKQELIPGTENRLDKKLSGLAQEYAETRDERMAILTVEVERKAALMAAMVEKGVTFYRDPETGLEAELVEGERKVKVRHPKDEDVEDEAA